MDEDLIQIGGDVSLHTGDRIIPGRISKILKNGKPVESCDWPAEDETYSLVLTTGDVVSLDQIFPGENCCSHCDKRLDEGPVGTFYCSCDQWKATQG